jgi:hypothetical protein
MTEPTNSGTPDGNSPAPSNNAPAQRPAMPTQNVASPEQNPRARGNSPAMESREQNATPADQKIRVGDGEFTAQELSDAVAAKAQNDIRKNTLPKSEAEYLARNSDNFQLPEGIRFEFDQNDATLAAAKKFAVANGLSQEQFSGMLDLFVSSKTGELMNQTRLRETNMQQLGAAGPARIDAVATWLNARAGKDGAAVAGFIKAHPAAPLVRAFESIIRQFSNQGGVNFDQRGRVAQETTEGKIPGYDGMSMVQRRVAQMQQKFGGKNER